MANALYPKYLEALHGGGNVDLVSDNVKSILIDLADYTYSAAHEFLDDIPAAARTATSANLANKTVTDGVFDADDYQFLSVTGDESEALIYYIDTGTEGTSRLVLYLDTGITGMPVTPNGTNIDVTVDAGANKIYRLAA